MLPTYRTLDARIDRLPRSELRMMQEQRLLAQIKYVYENTPFWRHKFDACGLLPGDIRSIEDITRIPFCTKQELQADQEEHPPFGSYTASHPTTWHKFVSTSGTTGRPLRRVFSARDWNLVIDRFVRIGTARPGDIVVILGPVDSLMGPSLSVDAFGRQGALVVCAGLYDTRTKVKLIRDLRPTIVTGTASYLLHIAEVAESMGVDFSTLGIRSISSVGEPGAAILETRERLQKKWGCLVGDGYGLTEIFSLGGNCRFSSSLHIHDDLVLTEVIDPVTGQPVSPGETGELVYTNLIGDTQPLLRYRSRDIGRLATDDTCACGWTVTRIHNGIEGRVDDMITYHGVNIYPSAIEACVRRFPELADEFQIVVETRGSIPTLIVRAEMRPEISTDIIQMLSRKLADELKASIRVTAQVELIPYQSLPRTDGKARRVIDNQRKAQI